MFLTADSGDVPADFADDIRHQKLRDEPGGRILVDQ